MHIRITIWISESFNYPILGITWVNAENGPTHYIIVRSFLKILDPDGDPKHIHKNKIKKKIKKNINKIKKINK